MPQTDPIANLRALAASWGYAVLSNVPYSAWCADDDLLPSPAFHSIGYDPERCYVSASDEEQDLPELVCGLIHELGHMVAGEDPRRPGNGCESRWFGWELAVSRWVGVPPDMFIAGNSDYSLEARRIGLIDIGHMTPRQRQWVFSERLQHARKLGLVRDDNDEPVCIRPGRWKRGSHWWRAQARACHHVGVERDRAAGRAEPDPRGAKLARELAFADALERGDHD